MTQMYEPASRPSKSALRGRRAGVGRVLRDHDPRRRPDERQLLRHRGDFDNSDVLRPGDTQVRRLQRPQHLGMDPAGRRRRPARRRFRDLCRAAAGWLGGSGSSPASGNAVVQLLFHLLSFSAVSALALFCGRRPGHLRPAVMGTTARSPDRQRSSTRSVKVARAVRPAARLRSPSWLRSASTGAVIGSKQMTG